MYEANTLATQPKVLSIMTKGLMNGQKCFCHWCSNWLVISLPKIQRTYISYDAQLTMLSHAGKQQIQIMSMRKLKWKNLDCSL